MFKTCLKLGIELEVRIDKVRDIRIGIEHEPAVDMESLEAVFAVSSGSPTRYRRKKTGCQWKHLPCHMSVSSAQKYVLQSLLLISCCTKPPLYVHVRMYKLCQGGMTH